MSTAGVDSARLNARLLTLPACVCMYRPHFTLVRHGEDGNQATTAKQQDSIN